MLAFLYGITGTPFFLSEISSKVSGEHGTTVLPYTCCLPGLWVLSKWLKVRAIHPCLLAVAVAAISNAGVRQLLFAMCIKNLKKLIHFQFLVTILANLLYLLQIIKTVNS